jgi:hypothetical protein
VRLLRRWLLENDNALDIAARTHGANPARPHRLKVVSQGRAEIFALPVNLRFIAGLDARAGCTGHASDCRRRRHRRHP